MTKTPTRKTIFTVQSSISLASKWRASKRSATSFADRYPEAYRKIAYATTKRNALQDNHQKMVAKWLCENI